MPHSNRTRETESRIIDICDKVSPSSLYVHIPFCRSRCFYCDFTTYVAPKPEVEAYVHWLCTEFSLLRSHTDVPLKTIFFGGGTPTYLSSSQLERTLDELHKNFYLDDKVEFTMEANPGTVSREKLKVLKDGGVNRLSFGAQTFDDNLLMAIGRSHDSNTVLESLEWARNAGFERINLDLMFGLPDQTMDSVERAVNMVVDLGVTHVSAYWLKVEPGTPFHHWQQEGLLPLPGEDAEADMYQRVQELFAQHGLLQYEVSNFCVPGQEAKHNLVYWRNEPYLAAGVGAHGYNRAVRYENVTSLSEYASMLSSGSRPTADTLVVSALESCENTMMLGLRLREGVSRSRFSQRHGVEMEDVFGRELRGLIDQGLLAFEGDFVRLTDKAWPISNLVFEVFVGALTSD